MAREPSTRRDAFSRALRVLLPFDLGLSAAIVVVWWVVGLVDPLPGVLLATLRVLAWFSGLRVKLGPVIDIQRRPEGRSDAELLAADAALQRVFAMAALTFSASWIAVDLLWVLLAKLGHGPRYGDAELATALFFIVATAGLHTLVTLVLSHALIPSQRFISAKLYARGVSFDRPKRKGTAPLVAAATWMMIGGMLAIGGGATLWNAQTQRELTAVFLRGQAEREATYLAIGAHTSARSDEAFAGDLEITTTEVLPPTLTGDGVPVRANGTRTYMDIERRQIIAATPVGDGRWVIASGRPDEQLRLFLGFALLLLTIALPLFSVGLHLFARSISAPLSRLAEAAERFVEHGELNALERFVPIHDDELGRLASSFNAMLDTLEQLTTAASAVSAGDLRVTLERPGVLHDAFRGMVARLNEIVARMRETSLEVAAAAAEIDALTQEQEAAAQTQSANIQGLASDVLSLASSAQQISSAAQGVQNNADRAVNTTNATAEVIAQLRAHATNVGELLRLIDEIAERSDLLALNGSLEAIRAGEAGRGFALVAAEMRRLAERVTGTVEDVRARVDDIERSGVATVIATEGSRELANLTAAASREITAAIEEQSANTEQASHRVQSVADQVVKATMAMSQTRTAAAGLREHAAELERLMATFELREHPNADNSRDAAKLEQR
ncbi:methyl-accepting chemotaxis protein [Pseudenhygromyxa sp. WMMC2535]|uniref:methyl-accepting chemotaxis protein n=1 Tax=Pseudenhygromyxa sp. WMMC2535 TaxID=2712867 RepID=UPI001551F45B|nr:methyl-accepting chemotaxis protein [Pseudenhygromyxa sp. WMMC2535]NVB41392.1 methyl-accepting chemotaxis protein [Pseudenhygromyxa sp. WMMC2535]